MELAQAMRESEGATFVWPAYKFPMDSAEKILAELKDCGWTYERLDATEVEPERFSIKPA